MHLDVRWVIGVLALVAVAAGGGYLVGTNRSGSIQSGLARSVETRISITGGGGWVYNVPLDVTWLDSSALHQGDRPACLPPTGIVRPVKFAAVQGPVNGLTWRAVVYVVCRD
jgi:hypothetical protein